MKQLFANNAKTTLASNVSATDTSFQLVDASIFPNPQTNEFFLVTFEIGDQIEIIRIVSRIGNTLYSSSVLDRGQEGTTAAAFPAATRAEARITRDTLNLFSKAFIPFGSVSSLLTPAKSLNSGYICSTFDTSGNPAMAIAKDDSTWRFLNYTVVQSGVSTTANNLTFIFTTTVNMTGAPVGRYLIQITSGANAGSVREISSYTSGSITWTNALSSIPLDGASFEILQSNSSIISETLATGDEAIIMALILGGN